MNILISGAGVAGLACALRLRQAGHRPTIIEKAPSLPASGYLVALSDRAYGFAEDLGVIDEIHRRALAIRQSSYIASSGRELLRLDYDRLFQGLKIVQIMRQDLVAALYESLPGDVPVHFGASIREVDEHDERVDVTLADGTSASYDLLIGADGVHSRTRRSTFAESEVGVRELGLCCAAFRSPNVLGLDRKFETHMDGDRYMASFTTREGDLGNVFVWATAHTQTPPAEQRARTLADAFAGAGQAIERVMQEVPQDGGFYFDAPIQIAMDRWHRRRVVLIGDAAHALTLFSGRGAACAFSGGNRLAQALIDEPDLDSAFARYEREMRPLIEVVQPATRNAVKWYVPQTPWQRRLRDGLMAGLPNAFFQSYFRRKYSYA